MKREHLPYFYLGSLLFILLFFVLPLPFYTISPGEVVELSVLGLEEKEGHLYAPAAKLYQNPYATRLGLATNGFQINLFAYSIALLSPKTDLIPIGEEEKRLRTAEMEREFLEESEEGRVVVVKLVGELLGRNLSEENETVDALYGSSGTLGIALELYHQLGKRDLVQQRRIGVSGQVDGEGNVLRVGGVRQKIVAAERAGLDLLILPKGNMEDVEENSFPIEYVGTVDEAIEFLA